MTAGRTREVWTYNGTTPGPILHGRVGDTFHITLVNHGTMGHSIDFHAGEVAPDQPMRTIEPGQSLDYTFTASRAGIWMYHCATMPMSSHIANGMFGAVVIEPDGLEQVDRSYVVVQSELYLGANGQPADAGTIAGLVPDVVAFNGRAFQYDAHPLTATVGQRVRQAVGAAVHLGERERPEVVDQRQLVGVADRRRLVAGRGGRSPLAQRQPGLHQAVRPGGPEDAALDERPGREDLARGGIENVHVTRFVRLDQ